MSWKIEVAKMFLYVSFPVGIFHYFNQPHNFEEWVINTKKEYFPAQSKQAFEEMEQFITEVNAAASKQNIEKMGKKLH